ncbi:MAG: hypothetical protein ACRCV6_02150 [Formosimonas sp.]
MKNNLKIFFAAICFIGFTACTHQSYKEKTTMTEKQSNLNIHPIAKIESQLLKVFSLSKNELRPSQVAEIFESQLHQPNSAGDYWLSKNIDNQWLFGFSISPLPQEPFFNFDLKNASKQNKTPCIDYSKFAKKIISEGWIAQGIIGGLSPQPLLGQTAKEVKEKNPRGDIFADYYIKNNLVAQIFLHYEDEKPDALICIERIVIK